MTLTGSASDINHIPVVCAGFKGKATKGAGGGVCLFRAAFPDTISGGRNRCIMRYESAPAVRGG